MSKIPYKEALQAIDEIIKKADIRWFYSFSDWEHDFDKKICWSVPTRENFAQSSANTIIHYQNLFTFIVQHRMIYNVLKEAWIKSEVYASLEEDLNKMAEAFKLPTEEYVVCLQIANSMLK